MKSIWTVINEIVDLKGFYEFRTDQGNFIVPYHLTKSTPTNNRRAKFIEYIEQDGVNHVIRVENRTVDIIPLSSDLQSIFLIKRKDRDEVKGGIAIPGGHIDPPELPLDAAFRELSEEVLQGKEAKKSINMILGGGFWIPERMAKGKPSAEHESYTQVFTAIMKPETNLIAGDDAESGKWYSLKDIPWNEFHFLHHVDILKLMCNWKTLFYNHLFSEMYRE